MLTTYRYRLEFSQMKMSVIGTGYLGAVHAACMAHIGHEVVAYDTDAAKIATLSTGASPFYEPGFDELLAEVLATGRLRFTQSVQEAVTGASVHFVCVGTPQLAGSDAANIAYVDSAFRSVAAHADCDGLVVGKSTVPVGTAQRLAAEVAETSSEHRLEVAWNPEFLREGKAIEDTLAPDRLVFGVTSEYAEKTLQEVYGSIIEAGTPHLTADLPTSELVKVAANAFLATKISFINAMAEVAEATGADVTQLADAIGHDARIGRRFLNAGVGFGGGCLPKDIRGFMARADELGVGESLSFLRDVDAINLRRRERVVQLAVEHLGGDVTGKRVAVLGLAFKPDSDDVRDSPALDVAARLLGMGATVTVTDPEAIETSRRIHPELDYVDSPEEAAADADVVLLLTEWRLFRDLDPESFGSLVSSRTIIDGRNVLDGARWRAAGWTYRGLGRP